MLAKRLLRTSLFCLLSLPVCIWSDTSNLLIQVIRSQTPITVNAFHSSQVLYTSPSGNVFQVSSQNASFYKVHMPANTGLGWISKSDVITYSGPTLNQTALDNMVLEKQSITRPKPVPPPTPYTYFGQENYRYPRKIQNKNIDLEVDGFYEVKISGRDFGGENFERLSVSDPRYDTILNDPIYNKIPRDVIRGDPKLDIRYHIQIDGELDDDLSVHYDIEQEPDFPGKYDVQVKHKDKELTFYHLDAPFNNGEFIAVNKALNGAKFTKKSKNLDLIMAMGKQRSEPKKLETFGTGQKRVNLGNTSIFSDSLIVWVNNKKKSEGADYTANYFEGYIEFHQAPQKNDFIEVIYEFTNPIEDFLPVLSRKNFIGSQVKWQPQERLIETRLERFIEEQLWPSKSPSASLVVEPSIETILKDLLSDNPASLNVSSPPTVEPLIKAFQLTHRYISLGSDTVLLNGEELERNVDYFIEHNKGTLSLINPINPKDTLALSYKYYLTSPYKADLIGKNSPGPYPLPHTNILDQSVYLELNGLELEETQDYILDYDRGELYFNYPVNYPEIISLRYDYIQSETVTLNAQKKPFSLGVTYMREYAKSQKDELEVQVPSESVSITANQITLTKTPLINTPSIQLSVDNTPVTASAINPYTGVITLPQSGSKAVVSYTYKKSFPSKLLFRITNLNNRSSAPFSSADGDFTLRDRPVKYKGVRYILLKQAGKPDAKLEEGESFEVDYGEDGQDISIQFFLNSDPSHRESKLEEYPNVGDQIEIDYLFTSSESLDPGDINQRMFGMTLGKQITDTWHIDTELALTDHNFSKEINETGYAEQVGTGQDNKEYPLGVTNIVEDSERVFIESEKGEFLQTKDVNYIINYTKGTVKFRNLTPQSSDTIKVYFSYYENSGTTQAGKSEQFKYATKVASQIKTDSVSLTNAFKYIDRKFHPIAPIKEKKGTMAFTTAFNWNINDHNSFQFNYDRKQIDAGEKDNNTRKYQVDDDFNAAAKVRLFNHFKTDSTVRYKLQLLEAGNTLVEGNNYDTDTLSYGMDNSVSFGPTYLNMKAKKGFSKSISDYLDKKNPNSTIVEDYDYTAKLSLNPVPIAGAISFSPYYNNAQTSKVYPDDRKQGFTGRQNYGFSSAITPKPYLSSNWSYGFTDLRSQENLSVSQNQETALNTNYAVNYTPYTWFKSSWNQSHSEAQSPLLNQKGRISDQYSFNISRFSFYGALTAWGIKHSNRWIRPFEKNYMTYRRNTNKTNEEDSKKLFSNFNESISFHSIAPIPSIVIKTIQINNQHLDNKNNIQTATSSQNITLQDSHKLKGNMSIRPKKPILKLFQYDYSFENNTFHKENNTLARSATSNLIIEDRPFFSRNQKLDFKPGNLIIKLPFKKNLTLGSFSMYLQEEREDKKNRTTTKQVPLLSTTAIPTDSIQADTRLYSKFTLGSKFSPFNLLSLNGIASSENTTLRRNLASNKGSTFQGTRTYQLTGDYVPFNFIKFNSKQNLKEFKQFTSDNLDSQLPTLVEEKKSGLFSDLKEVIENKTVEQGLRATLTPPGFFSFFSLVGGASFKDITEKITKEASFNKKLFNQRTGTAGTIFRPLKGMSLSYDYNITLTTSTLTTTSGETNNATRGYSGVTQFTYKPIKTKHVNIDIGYTRTDTWGGGLNTVQQTNSQQGTGDVIQTELLENRKDRVEIGSLNININLPLTNSPFVQSLVIEGQGYLKKVWDGNDPSYAENEKQSYEISGMLIKGSLLF